MGISISNRFGPVRVGTYVSDKELGGCLAGVIVIALVGLTIFWPYLLGSWLAGQFGAVKGGGVRTVTAWSFEVAYALAAIGIFAAVTARRKERGRQADIRTIKDSINAVDQVCARLEDATRGTADQRLPARERLLFMLNEVSLIEPRVPQRGQPKVPTEVATGDVLFTDRSVHFRSDAKQVSWSISQMNTDYEGSDYITWGMNNRALVSGVGGSILIRQITKGALLWAQQLPADPTRARDYFTDLHGRGEAALRALQT